MPSTPTTYAGLIGLVIDIINILIVVLFAGVFVYFIWKMIDSWILHAGDEKKRADGKRYAWSAIVVFVVMVSAWGIVRMIKISLFG